MRLIDADAFDERVRVAGGMSEEELTEDFKDGVQAVLYMLSKQPTIQPEPCEDAVSRETILKFFDGWMSALDENCHNQSVSDLKIIKRDFANLPSVTPKHRTGKWIKLDMHRGMADHKCTACEQECYVPTCMGEPLYAFCPNCGADMRGEQNG